jgi:hypothetical protein
MPVPKVRLPDEPSEEAPVAKVASPLRLPADVAEPVFRLKSPELLELPVPVLIVMKPPVDEEAAVEPAATTTLPPFPLDEAPTRRESWPAVEPAPTPTTTSPAAPLADAPVLKVTAPLAPEAVEPDWIATLPLEPDVERPDETETRPLGPAPLEPLPRVKLPLAPNALAPLPTIASPLLRPAETVEPVFKLNMPELLDGPLPVLTAMKPPVDAPLVEELEPAETTTLPPLPVLDAPLVMDTWPAAEPAPTASNTSPAAPDGDEPVRTVMSPLGPDADEPD